MRPLPGPGSQMLSASPAMSGHRARGLLSVFGVENDEPVEISGASVGVMMRSGPEGLRT